MTDQAVTRAQPGEWAKIAESHAIDARAKLVEALEALDAGYIRYATEVSGQASAMLRTASAFEYVSRVEAREVTKP